MEQYHHFSSSTILIRIEPTAIIMCSLMIINNHLLYPCVQNLSHIFMRILAVLSLRVGENPIETSIEMEQIRENLQVS